MRGTLLLFAAAILVAGCSPSTPEETPAKDTAVTGTFAPKSTPTPPPTPASPSAEMRQRAEASEKALKDLGVPIYAGAVVDPSQHSSDTGTVNAVFTTSATTKQVEYFYESYPELKRQVANGSTLFSGELNHVPVAIEIRSNKGITEITAQGKKP